MNGASFSPSASASAIRSFQHLDQPLHRAFARRLVVGMAPQFGFPHRRLRQVRRLLPAGLDHAAADIGAADIDREDAVIAPRKSTTAPDAGSRSVRHRRDRKRIGTRSTLKPSALSRMSVRAIASSPTRLCAKAAADHDAFGVGPRLGLEEAPGDIGQFLGEFLDRAMHQRAPPSMSSPTSASSSALLLISLGGIRRRTDPRRSSSAACASRPGSCGTRPCWRGRRESLRRPSIRY